MKHLPITLVILAAFYINNAFSSEFDCGVIDPSDGLTWDYFDPANHRPTNTYKQGHVKLVENTHLAPEMNSLETGHTGSGISGFLLDLDYTLQRIPNNPKALDMASRFQIRHGGQIPQMRKWAGRWTRSAECYFDRALRLTPNQPVVLMLYGMHLHRSGKFTEALTQYKLSEFYGVDSIELNYNMGLLYFDMKDYDLSADYAKKAYDAGYPLPGLRDKLKSLDMWQDDINTNQTTERIDNKVTNDIHQCFSFWARKQSNTRHCQRK